MNKEELFKKINSASKASQNAEEQKRINHMKEVEIWYEKAKALIPEAKELCELVNYAISQGYAVQTHNVFMHHVDGVPRLLTDGIDHTVGFYGQSMINAFRGTIDCGMRYTKIGIKNGGACGEIDIYIDTEAEDVFWAGYKRALPYSEYDLDMVIFYREHYWYGALNDLKRLVNLFADFKQQVMEFVENIDKYKCFK